MQQDAENPVGLADVVLRQIYAEDHIIESEELPFRPVGDAAVNDNDARFLSLIEPPYSNHDCSALTEPSCDVLVLGLDHDHERCGDVVQLRWPTN